MGRSTRGTCARARARASASPAAISRASFFACLRRDSRDGRDGRDFEAVIATSFHVSPVPAEFRLKEGALCTLLRSKQMGVFPCRGLVAPCQRTASSIKGVALRCQTRFSCKDFQGTLWRTGQRAQLGQRMRHSEKCLLISAGAQRTSLLTSHSESEARVKLNLTRTAY